MQAITVTPVIDDMKFNFAGKERETVTDPMYKRIDRNGRLYIDKDLAGEEVLIILARPMPEDKIQYIKVGRGELDRRSS